MFIFQLLHRSGFPPFKLHDAGRLVEQLPALLGLAAQDLVDLALSDDGVSLLTDTGIIKQLIHIFQTAGAVVDHIFTLTGTIKSSRHRHFLIINGKLMIPVIQRDRHIGISQRLSHLRPGKNNILHRSAA